MCVFVAFLASVHHICMIVFEVLLSIAMDNIRCFAMKKGSEFRQTRAVVASGIIFFFESKVKQHTDWERKIKVSCTELILACSLTAGELQGSTWPYQLCGDCGQVHMRARLLEIVAFQSCPPGLQLPKTQAQQPKPNPHQRKGIQSRRAVYRGKRIHIGVRAGSEIQYLFSWWSVGCSS